MAIHLLWPARVTPATLWVSAYYQQGSNQLIARNSQSEIKAKSVFLIVLSLEHKSQGKL